jgi:phenylacetate-CoA ligase
MKIPFLKDSYYTIKGILLYHSFLKNSCYWDRNKLENYQFKKLKLLLIDSYENIPYYKELFSKIQFNPNTDFNQLSDLKLIPILSKEIAKSRQKEFINQKYISNSLLFKTSGSTGSPFQIYVHPNQWIIEQGVIWRHWKWAGYRFYDALAMVRSFVPKSERELWKTSISSNFTFYSPFHMNDLNISRYLKIMIDKKTTVLRGYPSSLVTMADYVLKYKAAIPNIKMILTASEVLTEDDRAKIELAFNAKISNHYGLAEQIVMMGDCEKHEGLHHYDEYGYLELLDTDTPNVKRIIGTNLHNLTTPLIRYDTGDLAIISEKPCSCGRSLPTIKNIMGRHDSVILTPEGYKIPTVNFYTMFEEFQEVDQWQIVQVSKEKLDFIIKTDKITQDRISELENKINTRLKSSMIFDVCVNKKFVQKGEGKINTFVSMLN